ncbi:MAG: TlyA family RNA methyltransferase [Devosia sp.]|uniref:TlyA family RNA methyltransferase n=1 Tax=Devosia sp. TaxID=1871048 RepID=UPI001A5D08B9|nr:TlyA family RNA methyltransferase [Devosia sp.]MBL8596570.1 TlyA family RNA methyltransferase [Devosia sp.]
MSDRVRLDLALEQRGLVQSRARARDAVLRGTVTINGAPAAKPSQMVGPGDSIALDDPAGGYVSRAALKLIAGLDAGGIAVAGKVCLDVGASTGGFTQVLAERGAAKIYAVDVGRDQLHPQLQALGNVESLEGLNARDLTDRIIREPIDLLVCDVSFVSVTKVLGTPLALCRSGADAVILIKPQFEVGRDNIGKGGIVTDAAAIARARDDVVAFLARAGWSLRQALPSPISGGDGNKEIVALFRCD